MHQDPAAALGFLLVEPHQQCPTHTPHQLCAVRTKPKLAHPLSYPPGIKGTVMRVGVVGSLEPHPPACGWGDNWVLFCGLSKVRQNVPTPAHGNGAVRRFLCWWLCGYQPHQKKRVWAD